MHGSTGGSWRRSTLIMATGVAQPAGKPAEHRPRDLPVSRCHRASSRPNHPQRADCPQFSRVLDRVRVPRPGRGRPRQRPDRVLADRPTPAAPTAATGVGEGSRQRFRSRPTSRLTAARRDPRVGAHRCSTRSATDRHGVECGINLLKQHRAVATRYDKVAVCYEATVHIAAINVWHPGDLIHVTYGSERAGGGSSLPVLVRVLRL
jgi:hypothetical protein